MNQTLSKFKTSALSKDTAKRMKRQAADQRKIFTKYIVNKELHPEFTKDSYNSIRQLNQTMGRDTNRYFTKENTDEKMGSIIRNQKSGN